MCLMSIYGLWQCFSVIPVLCMVFLVYWNNGEIAIKTFKQSSNDIVLFYAKEEYKYNGSHEIYMFFYIDSFCNHSIFRLDTHVP